MHKENKTNAPRSNCEQAVSTPLSLLGWLWQSLPVQTISTQFTQATAPLVTATQKLWCVWSRLTTTYSQQVTVPLSRLVVPCLVLLIDLPGAHAGSLNLLRNPNVRDAVQLFPAIVCGLLGIYLIAKGCHMCMQLYRDDPHTQNNRHYYFEPLQEILIHDSYLESRGHPQLLSNDLPFSQQQQLIFNKMNQKYQTEQDDTPITTLLEFYLACSIRKDFISSSGAVIGSDGKMYQKEYLQHLMQNNLRGGSGLRVTNWVDCDDFYQEKINALFSLLLLDAEENLEQETYLNMRDKIFSQYQQAQQFFLQQQPKVTFDLGDPHALLNDYSHELVKITRVEPYAAIQKSEQALMQVQNRLDMLKKLLPQLARAKRNTLEEALQPLQQLLGQANELLLDIVDRYTFSPVVSRLDRGIQKN